jgi:hypothetical protein
MMKGRSWNLQGMESIEDSMDPRAKDKMRMNMKIPRKKEKPEQLVIILRITKTISLV